MSLGMNVWAYSGVNQNGVVRNYSMSRNARYRRVSSERLIDDDLYFTVNSSEIHRNSLADSNLILFFHGVVYVPDFTGYFVQVRHPSDADNYRLKTNTPNLSCQSMLLSRTSTGNEIRISAKQSFLPLANALIEASLPSIVQRDGDPVFTWSLWPKGVSYLDPKRRYLKVIQKLRIRPVSKTYSATITYHIYLRLNGAGEPRASGARWSYWIEGGALTNKIAAELEPAVRSGLTTVVDTINSVIGSLAGGATFTDLFYLPGNNTLLNAPQVWGHTSDDVTIVLEV